MISTCAKIQWEEGIESCLPKPFNLKYGLPGEQHGEQKRRNFLEKRYLIRIFREDSIDASPPY